jgi:hypothetical protein
MGAAEPVPASALDDELALTNAPFQAGPRFVAARLVQGRCLQAFDAHALAAALERGSVESAAALSGRSGAGHDHCQPGEDRSSRDHETLLRKTAHARYFAL